MSHVLSNRSKVELSGFWCDGCGMEYGVAFPSKLRSVYELQICDGCGLVTNCLPAFRFKVTVASARAAINCRAEAAWKGERP